MKVVGLAVAVLFNLSLFSQSYDNFRLVDSLFPFQTRTASIKNPIPQIKQLPESISDSVFSDFINYLANDFYTETNAQVLRRYGLDTNAAYWNPKTMLTETGLTINIEDSPSYVIEAETVFIGLYGFDLSIILLDAIDINFGEEWFIFTINGAHELYQRGLLHAVADYYARIFGFKF
jgi:hypothetical protein